MIDRRFRVAAAMTLALSGLFGISGGRVWAHAQYAGSVPAANSSVQAAPSVVQITFTEELADIRISITGPHGAEVTTAPAKFDLEQRHNASVTMSDDGAGVYTVLWHNVSGDDGDPNDGQFVFTVAAAPAPAATQAPAQAAPAAQTRSQAPAPPTCMDSGVPTPGINDSRIDTYCKRQAIRDKYAGQIDVATFNAAVADGEGLESALADAMADFQAEQARKKH
jgi:methionine-rich copper-binding protein CopC